MQILYAILLVALPFALAAAAAASAEALRDVGVRVPRVMRSGPWRSR